jgi:uncharacterized protein (DUF58 family)
VSQPEDDVPPVPPMPNLPPRPRPEGPAMPARMPSERATHLSSLKSLSGQPVRTPEPPVQPYQPPPPPPTLPPSASSRYLRPQDLRRFENFQFAAKMVVEGFYSGRHRSPFHDRSAEFSDYRPYVPGDEIRSLDWRAYARTDRDYIKLFRKETDMRCHVLLDTSRSMAFRDEAAVVAQTTPRPGLLDRLRRRKATADAKPMPPTAALSKFEYGAYLTAGLCYLMIQQGDKASLALGASSLNTFVPPGGTITHLHGMLNHLERTQPDGETALANAVKGLFALTRQRGLLVVVSDFLEEPDPLFDALAMYTYRGWQILLLHVLTETELNLPGSGPQNYLDAETPGRLDADPDSLRAAYQSELQEWLQSLETQAKARGIHYSRMTTATPYDQALERYLTTRQ